MPRFNRPSFEDRTQDTMRRPDLIDIQAYYSRSPSSGFWLLELGKHVIGILAIDASTDSTSQDIIKDKQQVQYTKGTASTAVIRHFFVEEQYRKTKIQDDLLIHSLKEAFVADKDKHIRTVIADEDQLASYIGRSLRQHGFNNIQGQYEERKRSVGILGWTISPCSLDRERWDNM
jgi:hypothetical protein